MAAEHGLVFPGGRPAQAGIASSPPLASAAAMDGSVDFMRAGGALAFCLLLAVGLIFLIRKVRNIPARWRLEKNQGSHLKVLESLRLDPAATLYVVEFGAGAAAQSILLVQDAGGVRQLAANAVQANGAAPVRQASLLSSD